MFAWLPTAARNKRGAQFREPEIMAFLELALERLPISGKEWDIALEHGLNPNFKIVIRAHGTVFATQVHGALQQENSYW